MNCPTVIGIDNLHRNCLSRQIITRSGQVGLDKRVTKRHMPRGIYGDISPNPGIAIPDPVQECKVPTHGHQLRHVSSDLSVATVLELIIECTNRFLPFWFYCTRHIYGINFNCQYVCPIKMNVIGYIYMILIEHAGNVTYHLTVQPQFGAVIDPVYLQPRFFILEILGGCLKLCSEPVGIEIATRMEKIRNQV